eukprot:290367_1
MEVQMRSEIIARTVLRNGPIIAKLMNAAWVSGEFGKNRSLSDLAQSTDMDQYFLELMNQYELSGIMLGTSSGNFVGAYRTNQDDQIHLMSSLTRGFTQHTVDKNYKRINSTMKYLGGRVPCGLGSPTGLPFTNIQIS